MASANARPGNRGGHQLVSLLLLLAVSLVAGPAAWSADPPVQRWPIKEFEVVSARPWIDASGPFDAWLNRLSEQSGAEFDQRMAAEEPLNLAMRDAMEDYLNRAARQLEAWGFPPPRLEPIVTRRDGKRAYRVFYTDLADASGEYWYKRRGYEGLRRRPVIILSGSSDTLSWPIQTGSTRGVTVSPFGKSVLGHELFHAVQYSMPFFRSGSYDVGDWVAEGTAEAVGEDLYRILEGMFGQDAERAWGLRNYAIRLPVQRVSARATPPLATYGTASFWRYLAELHARPRHGKPGPDPQSVDYGYLVALFNRTAGSSGAAAELRWLDEGLREAQRIGAKGLYRIFPTSSAPMRPTGSIERRATLVIGAKTPSVHVSRWQSRRLRPRPSGSHLSARSRHAASTWTHPPSPSRSRSRCRCGRPAMHWPPRRPSAPPAASGSRMTR